jgi:hypothetical protein
VSQNLVAGAIQQLGLGDDSRRARIVQWVLERRDLDDAHTVGKLIFDLGRGQDGRREVSWQFIPRPERLT